jgi:hypothetical protein
MDCLKFTYYALSVFLQVLLNVTNRTHVKISGLVPHATYNITISAKPLNYGLVSDEVYIRHEMNPDGE